MALAAWQSVGPDGGNIQALAIDPVQPERLYAVPYEYPANCRVFRSLDHGESWTVAGTIPYQSVTALAADPHNSNLLYALARGTVLYRSTDCGQNWTQAALPGYANALTPDRAVAGRVYLAGYYNYSGAYRAAAYVSTDYGLNWNVSMPAPDTTSYAYAVAADPQVAGTVYLGAYSTQLYKSTDAGASWTRSSSGIPANSTTQALSVNPGNSLVVLAAQTDGVYRSIDAGANWNRVGDMTGAMSVAFGADGATACALGRSDSIRVWVSSDSGATWFLPRPGYTTSKAAQLQPDPAEPQTAWLNSPTGIYRSTDLGANWGFAHSGLRISKIGCISASPADMNRLYIEVMDNGVFKTATAGDSWTRCNDFLSCGSICGIGVAVNAGRDILYAFEGSG
jgi:photosystem II stability/assembly factor-like uncharacterized protein